MTINWGLIERGARRGTGPATSVEPSRQPTTQEVAETATRTAPGASSGAPNPAVVKAAKALPAKFPTPWDKPKTMPTISDVDFSKVDVQSLPIKSLLASNKNLKGPKVVWHVQHPGQRVNMNPFTEKPLVLSTDEGNVIVDGHHFLYAQQLLGQTKADCYVCPSK